MRVAMVSEHASPLAAIGGEDAGGQNVHVAALSRRLAAAGHEVVVWTRRDDPTLPDRMAVDGITVAHVDAGPPAPVTKDRLPHWMDDFTAALARHWSSAPPDVIHSHFWMSGQAALRARPAAVPVVHTFHALGVVKRRHLGGHDPSPAGRVDAERTIAGAVDHVVATCRDEVRELAALGADPRRVTVVPCGVDTGRFTPHGPVDPDDGDERPRVVSIGRLVRRKGFDDVVRAVAVLPDVELVVAGGPPRAQLAEHPEARRLRALAAELGAGDRVVLRGAVARDRMPALLRSATVVACAPWYEPFGIVPLEAMACGVPVVATAVGGMLDTVTDGVTGVHVAPGDPDAIARAVRMLVDEPACRDRLGAAGRRHAVDRFRWDAVADATLRVYEAVLRRAPVATGVVGPAGVAGR